MADPKKYDEIEAALLRAAMGYSYEEKSMSQTDAIHSDGGTSTKVAQLNEHKVQPNIAVLREILSERIGGPQDYC